MPRVVIDAQRCHQCPAYEKYVRNCIVSVEFRAASLAIPSFICATVSMHLVNFSLFFLTFNCSFDIRSLGGARLRRVQGQLQGRREREGVAL